MASEPPRILAFDTAAAHCAAVLVRGDAPLARRDEPMARGQAERLLPMLEEMLAEAGMDWRDLDALAICTGPGNFTGLRIAVAAARGLALGLGIPAVGVSRFEALAEGVAGPVRVALQDPKGEVVVQHFRDGVPLGPPLPEGAEPARSYGTRVIHGPETERHARIPKLGNPGIMLNQNGKFSDVYPALTSVNAADPVAGAVCLGFAAAEAARRLGLAAGSEETRADLLRLARVAARRLAGPETPPPPAPLYIRPADATPAPEPVALLLDDA